ncbi:MAG: hypothetical protein JO056_13600 [Alphaproteobacteria bacterium]|nr:hypothetical protein [Alphaproteobacteria bacterium]
MLAPDVQARKVKEKTLSVSQTRADFEQLYGSLQEAHFNLFARISKPEYDRLYRQVLGTLTAPAAASQVALRFQRFAAFGKVAHARIDANYRNFAQFMAGGGKAFPLLIRVIGSKTYVAENRSGINAIARGDEITKLNGRPIEYWLSRCGRNLSADTPYMAHALMELDFPMLLWLELGPQPRFNVTVRRAGSSARTIALPARGETDMKAFVAKQSPVLRLDGTQRVARMMENGVAYLRPGAFYNTDPNAKDEYDNTAFRLFVDSSFRKFLAAGATSLVIDIRDNPGGDSSFSDLMLAWFADKPFRFASSFQIKVSKEAIASNDERLKAAPGNEHDVSHQYAALYASARPGGIVPFPVDWSKPRAEPRFKGNVYLLVNRNSYSNCVAVAATVQDYSLGTVIGEETSDLATTYGAMESFTLRESGLKVGFPKAYIVRPSGDQRPRGVVPDIAIPTPLVEDATDPVLQQAVSIAATRK